MSNRYQHGMLIRLDQKRRLLDWPIHFQPQCNIDEDLILTTAQLMKSLGLQVSTCSIRTYAMIYAKPFVRRLWDTIMLT